MDLDSIEAAIEVREFNNRGLWPDQRMGYEETVDLSLASLRTYGEQYPTWMVSYSGGKDSSATLSFVAWAIQEKLVPTPERLIVLYADTGMELPPLYLTAMRTLEELAATGVETRHVRPELDKRFFVYMLGRGVPPPLRMRRWCTERLKAEPMNAAYKAVYEQYGDNVLSLTGVRMGESAIRDNRILMSCSKNDGECGQGWFQRSRNALAPMMHWRVCHVWRWIYRPENPIKAIKDIADIYLYDDLVDIRTGCIECNIVDHDLAFKSLLRKKQWSYLRPLTGLRALYNDLLLPANRLRKTIPDHRLDKHGSLGPLTMDARLQALERIKEMQAEANYPLISGEEESRIRELIDAGQYPNGWTGDEAVGIEPYDQYFPDGSSQPVML